VNADVLVFALGGKSQEKLGSDGNYIDELSGHGYKIKPFLPSLCPIKTKEKVKKLSGIRHKAKITAYASNELIYEEEGEMDILTEGFSPYSLLELRLSKILKRRKTNVQD
jgi:predicted flavoprotein YhiN